jgi:diguanylate cyclase (GGDEF)-like protein
MAATACLGLLRTDGLKRVESRVLAVGFVLLVAMVATTAASAVGIGGHGLQTLTRNVVGCAIYVLVAAIVALRAIRLPTKRGSWIVFALGLSLYGLGNVLWTVWIDDLRHPPIPSICDGLWLAFYPLSYAGIVGFAVKRGNRKLPAGVWLDGIVAGTAIAALGAALVFHPVLASLRGEPTASVATELAYPIGDLLLAVLVVGILALRGWHLDRTWALLGASFLLLAVADCLYAVGVANGSSNTTSVMNLFYFLAVALMAFAAWQPEAQEQETRLTSWSVVLVPAGFTLIALGLLFYNVVHRLEPLAIGLATASLFALSIRAALAFRDLRSLAEARALAGRDDLTSLPNRRLFIHRMRAAIAAARVTDSELAVLMLDLDNFKQLNDTLGHDAGDELLRLIGPRLEQVLRVSDTVARLGGDEFGILLDSTTDRADIGRVAEKLLDALREPFEVQGLALRITASIGVTLFPAQADGTEQLMKNADIAMYHAKAAHSGYEFYERVHDTNSQGRLVLAADLAKALEHGGIVIHFQPQADCVSRRIVGAEALVRLQLPGGRLVPPLEFLAAAEHAGLSRSLTRKVLDLALDQLAIWRAAGHELHLAVNTTVSDLLDARFPGEVAAALAARGLPPDALILELTETSILSDPQRIGDVLARLGELGIGLSLDDFGTGYSSLTHLKWLPISEVKIDRSFAANMCNDATDAAIVDATIELAHKLGIRVVAEGVEDAATWTALQALECDLIQGYILSRPVTAAELDHQLTSASSIPSKL